MADRILVTGDQAVFTANFGLAVIVPLPGVLVGTGRLTISGRPVCVEGDEKSLIVPGCSYFAPQYPVPGVGTLTIRSLNSDQIATKTRTGGKAVLLKGSSFSALLQVMAPASHPSYGPDATPQYSGSGTFVSTNATVTGS